MGCYRACECIGVTQGLSRSTAKDPVSGSEIKGRQMARLCGLVYYASTGLSCDVI